MSDPRTLEAHLFICTNRKERGACCAERGGGALRDEVKRLAASRPEWKGRVRVNASGCLGHCESGVAAVLYPEGRWFTELKGDDASAATLMQALEASLSR